MITQVVTDTKGISRTALLNIVITSFCRAEAKHLDGASGAETVRDSTSRNEVFEPVELDAVFDYDPFEDLRL